MALLISFNFCQLFEMYVFALWHSKFAKSAALTQKYFWDNDPKQVIKNAEFMLMSKSLMTA